MHNESNAADLAQTFASTWQWRSGLKKFCPAFLEPVKHEKKHNKSRRSKFHSGQAEPVPLQVTRIGGFEHFVEDSEDVEPATKCEQAVCVQNNEHLPGSGRLRRGLTLVAYRR